LRMAADDREALIRAATAAVLAKLADGTARTFSAPVGVSGRHAHLAPGDLKTLFGPGASLTVEAPLVQTAQFRAAEVFTVIGPTASLPGVRVVGPTRPATVVELAAGDVARLGLDGPERAAEPFPVTLAGPAGVIHLPEGGVIARRHLHASRADGEKLGLVDGQVVSVRLGVPGRRLVFDDVLVRVSEQGVLELHIDRDEANACGGRTGDRAEIIVGGPGARAAGSGGPAGTARRLVTEAEVVAAYRAGRAPDVEGALLTPFARDAIAKYFPELLKGGN
jgi:putative phosphotransacetylase